MDLSPKKKLSFYHLNDIITDYNPFLSPNSHNYIANGL